MHDYRDRNCNRKSSSHTARAGIAPEWALGIFITGVRINFGGDWRLLEASVRAMSSFAAAAGAEDGGGSRSSNGHCGYVGPARTGS